MAISSDANRVANEIEAKYSELNRSQERVVEIEGIINTIGDGKKVIKSVATIVKWVKLYAMRALNVMRYRLMLNLPLKLSIATSSKKYIGRSFAEALELQLLLY